MAQLGKGIFLHLFHQPFNQPEGSHSMSLIQVDGLTVI
jgi:hypothetical protein